MNGGFSPLDQFMDQETYNNVVENTRLGPKFGNLLFPIPITLDVSEKVRFAGPRVGPDAAVAAAKLDVHSLEAFATLRCCAAVCRDGEQGHGHRHARPVLQPHGLAHRHR